DQLQKDIANLTRTWRDNLEERILSSNVFSDPSLIWYRYSDAFHEDYQALQSVEECEKDIITLESLNDERSVRVSMSTIVSQAAQTFVLIVYQLDHEITISHAVPI